LSAWPGEVAIFPVVDAGVRASRPKAPMPASIAPRRHHMAYLALLSSISFDWQVDLDFREPCAINIFPVGSCYMADSRHSEE
jgi:hypothetical protein